MMLRIFPTSLVALLAVSVPGCAEQRFTGPSPAQSTARILSPSAPSVEPNPPGAAAETRADASTPAEEPPHWSHAVRYERWEEAARLLDAVPEADRGRPELRYVRARVAIAVSDHARAVALLGGLEAELPLLQADVERYRAEAALEAGPYLEAAAYFEKSRTPSGLRSAALAYDRAKEPQKARALADRAVATAKKAKDKREESAARLVRARLKADAGHSAAAVMDLRWVATEVPGSVEGLEATARLETLSKPLTTRERLRSVDLMVEDGRARAALDEIERIAASPGVQRGELLHRKAMALYRARDFEAAAMAFDAAAKVKDGREAEQLYHAARSLARADKDDAAIERYLDVAKRFRATVWGERAQYLGARLLMEVGRYQEAVDAYSRYLATFPRGSKRESADYEKTLSLLSSGNPKTAERHLARLGTRAKGDDVGKLRQLEGVARMRAGDRPGAIAIWTEVVRGYPLSWAALVARSRLLEANAPVPPLLEGSEPRAADPLEVKLPPVVAMLASLGLDGDAEGYLVNLEKEATSEHAGREKEALCSMYGKLSHARRRYRIGVWHVSRATLMRAPTDAERWAWDCVYPRPYEDHVVKLEQTHELPRGLIHSLMRQESAFDPVIVSPANAVGLMQLIPPTARAVAKELSLDIELSQLTSPEINIRLGAFYIGKLMRMFGGNMMLASAAYNAGPKAVQLWLEPGADNDMDLWVARIPYNETRNYVARVMGNLARYQWLEGGDAAVPPIPLALTTVAPVPSDAY